MSFAFVRVHQIPPPCTVVTTSSCSLLLIYRPRKGERLSWLSWVTNSGQFTHISGHPSAVGRAQDSESSPVKDQRSIPLSHETMLAMTRVSYNNKCVSKTQYPPYGGGKISDLGIPGGTFLKRGEGTSGIHMYHYAKISRRSVPPSTRSYL